MNLIIDMAGVSAGICSDVDRFSHAVLLPVQTHSCTVAEVDSPCPLPDTDAIITRTPGLRIGVRTADCVPLLLHAPDIRAVAAIHAGWKGTLGNITGKRRTASDRGRSVAATDAGRIRAEYLSAHAMR